MTACLPAIHPHLQAQYPRLYSAYEHSNVSGQLYARLLSQDSLLKRSKALSAQNQGTVYRPQQASLGKRDAHKQPVSTLVDMHTAFWQGATARAAAQRTVSAVGLALSADILGVMGPEGMARWGNHPLAVVLRASLPLRVAAWPGLLWNQNLAVMLLGAWAGPIVSTTVGSGLAEYVVGTGFRDDPAAPQVSPGYMVVPPAAFEDFKAHGLLGMPEQVLIHRAEQLSCNTTSRLHQLGATGCLLGATLLRGASQLLRVPLCAVWACELLLGGLVAIAHVAANHVMQLATLMAQELGSYCGINEAPSRPMWQSLPEYDAAHGLAQRQAHAQGQADADQEHSSASSSSSSSPKHPLDRAYRHFHGSQAQLDAQPHTPAAKMPPLRSRTTVSSMRPEDLQPSEAKPPYSVHNY